MDNVPYEGFKYRHLKRCKSNHLSTCFSNFSDLEMIQVLSVNNECYVCKSYILNLGISKIIYGQYLYLSVLREQSKSLKCYLLQIYSSCARDCIFWKFFETAETFILYQKIIQNIL